MRMERHTVTGLEPSTIEAKEEVMTTRLTVGAFFLMAFKMPVVPMMAGSRRSFLVSVMFYFGVSIIFITSRG